MPAHVLGMCGTSSVSPGRLVLSVCCSAQAYNQDANALQINIPQRSQQPLITSQAHACTTVLYDHDICQTSSIRSFDAYSVLPNAELAHCAVLLPRIASLIWQ